MRLHRWAAVAAVPALALAVVGSVALAERGGGTDATSEAICIDICATPSLEPELTCEEAHACADAACPPEADCIAPCDAPDVVCASPDVIATPCAAIGIDACYPDARPAGPYACERPPDGAPVRCLPPECIEPAPMPVTVVPPPAVPGGGGSAPGAAPGRDGASGQTAPYCELPPCVADDVCACPMLAPQDPAIALVHPTPNCPPPCGIVGPPPVPSDATPAAGIEIQPVYACPGIPVPPPCEPSALAPDGASEPVPCPTSVPCTVPELNPGADPGDARQPMPSTIVCRPTPCAPPVPAPDAPATGVPCPLLPPEAPPLPPDCAISTDGSVSCPSSVATAGRGESSPGMPAP
jgi:hypothetical protein